MTQRLSRITQLEELKILRVLDWVKYGRPQAPILLDFSLTNACNLSCLFCWKRAKKFNTSFDTERAIALMRNAGKMGVRMVRLTGGGEPFYHPGAAIAVMQDIKRQGMYGTVVTNATKLNRSLIRRIVCMGWDELIASIDGATANTHDSLRGKQGVFATTIKALELLTMEKRHQQSGIPVLKLNFVLTTQNFRELPAYISLAAKYGVTTVKVIPLVNTNPDIGRYRLSKDEEDELQRILLTTMEYARREDIVVNTDEICHLNKSALSAITLPRAESGKSEPSSSNLPPTCYEPFHSIFIRADGAVVPCCCWNGPLFFQLGSSTLETAWFSDQFNELRKRFIQGIRLDHCRNCVAFQKGVSDEMSDRLSLLWANAAVEQKFRETTTRYDMPSFQ